MVKNPPANARRRGSISELGRSPSEGNGNPLQYFCLGNPRDKGARQATVHGVSKSRTLVGKVMSLSFNIMSRLVRKQQLEMDMEQQIDWFQIGKGGCQGCILSPCLFNFYAEYIMRNAGLEKHKLENPHYSCNRKA